MGLAAIGIVGGAAWQVWRARDDIRALTIRGEDAARDREQTEAMARALALPSLETILGSLRSHLPPGVRLVEAARSDDGTLRLAIDTPDPDALRGALRADAWLIRFRERGQDAREDGMIRVRLIGPVP